MTRRANLPYWRGLDGLRAVALIAVLAYHQGFDWARGGFLGVSVFFTLSGFLITRLLLTEHERRGTIGLGQFWARRARRLAPAGLLAVLLAIVATSVALPEQQHAEALGDVRAALAYIANWHFIWADVPYADLLRVPSPVQHFWSLAIEEQFYVFFPLIALVTLRRRRAVLGVVLTVVTIGSVALQLRFGPGDRTYYGTDTRAAELAIGGLLALVQPWLAQHRTVVRRHLADIGGIVGIGALLALFAGTDLAQPALYAGGLAATAVVSSLVVFAAVDGPLVSRVLGWEPLRAIGRVSYGAYVFHLPLYLMLDESRTGLRGVPLFAARLAAVAALSAASFAYVESPIRERRVLARPRRALPAFGVAVTLLVLATVPADDGSTTLLETASETVTVITVPQSTDATTTTTGGAPTTSIVPRIDGSGAVPPPTAPVVGATPPPTTPPPPRPIHLLVVGDSTAAANGKGLAAWGAANGLLTVEVVADSGCTVLPGDRVRLREGVEYAPPDCEPIFRQATEMARSVDAVLFFIGSPQLTDRRYFGTSAWRSVDDAEVGAAYEAELVALLDRFAALDKPILWADVAVPDWDLDMFFAQLGAPPAGEGPATLNSAPRTGALNAHDARVTGRYARVRPVPYAALLAAREAELGHSMRADGLHLDDANVADLAEHGLHDAIRAAYEQLRPG